MNAAGIDVSSRKSTVAVLRPFGEVVKLPFDVTHSAEGLAALVQQLKSIEGETRVVMEHTGRYYEPVAQALHTAGFYVSAVNPLLIKEYGGNSLRRVKTDKADAMKIARYALDNWSELRDYTPMEELCGAMMELLTKPYEQHMIDFLCDAEHYFGMTRDDFAPWEGRVLLILSEDDTTFTPACREDLIALMPSPTVVTDLCGGHLALMVRLEQYADLVTKFILERT